MYFNIISDTGHEVHGYLIPDGFSSKPRILVCSNGVEIGPLDCPVFLPGPYEHKHHETGNVGFVLTTENVPGLSADTKLEIADAESGFVFYRRFNPELHIPKRVFRLETQFVPHSELDRCFDGKFQFFASEVEHYGSETVRQMLEIRDQVSTYVSGRVLLRSVQQYLNNDSLKITSLRDPFYELTLRLITIANYKKKPFSFVSRRDQIIFEPAMQYFANTDFSNSEQLLEKIKSAPKEVLGLFESPFCKQLVASSPTDHVVRDSLPMALDALSQFSLLDPDEKDDQLTTDIAETLGIEPQTVQFKPVQETFSQIADTLRELPVLEHILELDLILYFFVQKARARSMSSIETSF